VARPIDLHFFAPSIVSGRALEAALHDAGYPETSVSQPKPEDGSVSVTARAVAAPSAVAAVAQVRSLLLLAASVGAEHDGWGTSVRPSSSPHPTPPGSGERSRA
jgi:regulator of RNase E activity RraB